MTLVLWFMSLTCTCFAFDAEAINTNVTQIFGGRS